MIGPARAPRALLTPVVAILAGCVLAPTAGPTSEEVRPPLSAHVDVSEGEGSSRLGVEMPAEEPGTLTLMVRWPTPLRTTQLIPLSAKAIQIDVLTAQGDLAASRTATRQPGAGTSVITVPLAAGNGYRVTARAFAEETPGPGSQPIAQGDASNVLIRKSKTTQVALEIVPLTAPAITELSPANGGIGRMVRIKGRNFGLSTNLDCQVRFGQTLASELARIDDETLQVKVPTGALSGNVAVIVDGVDSVSSSPFQVIRNLTFAAIEGLFLTAATRSLVIHAADTSNAVVLDPILDWSSDQPNIVSVDQTGLVTSWADGAATVSVRASTGTASASLALPVWPRPMMVSVTPATGLLNAAAEDGINDPAFVTRIPVEAVVTYSDQSTDSAVTWTTSNAALGMWSGGAVVTANNAPAGTLVITATAMRDGKTKGSASFEVTTLGNAVVTVK